MPLLLFTIIIVIIITYMLSDPPNLMVCPPPCLPPPMAPACTSEYTSGDTKLRKIADDLRELMPLNAILPTEQITFPSVGEVRLTAAVYVIS